MPLNLSQPFFQITLPLMVTFVITIWAASWAQNKRLEEMSKRLDDIVARLTRIESWLMESEKRLTSLEAVR